MSDTRIKKLIRKNTRLIDQLNESEQETLQARLMCVAILKQLKTDGLLRSEGLKVHRTIVDTSDEDYFQIDTSNEDYVILNYKKGE